uniref:DDE Tnp4 domain-containing protein n=2 Tax=Spongospora subterranea TaxID=70186 RepID=A0A0H5R6T1_9EUKA|eukprot:CRZ04004.1 hypothetical protein [Spongospora subterranea]
MEGTFGLCLPACLRVWLDIRCSHADLRREHLLMGLNFLQSYRPEDVACPVFKISAKNYRKWVWIIINCIANLDYIHWEDRWENWSQLVPSFTLDGTDLWVFEQSFFDKNDMSHKFKHAGLRYEIGLAIGVSKIVHVAGGVPCGSWPDIRLARHCVVPKLIKGEKPSADKGYRDGRKHFFTPIEHPSSEKNHLLNRQLKLLQARHEMVNKRFKDFRCLKEQFRHSRKQHQVVFAACANLVQLKLIEQPLLWVSYILGSQC